MIRPESESKPIAERLLPQTTIRFFCFLIGVSAVGMFTFRSAIVADQLWAKCAAAVLATAIGCFIAYFLLFLIANLFSSATATLIDGPLRRERSEHRPPAASDASESYQTNSTRRGQTRAEPFADDQADQHRADDELRGSG